MPTQAVQIVGRSGDQRRAVEVDAQGRLYVRTFEEDVDNPVVINQTLTVADTEYAVALPGNTRAFEFQCRTENDVRYAYVPGRVAAPVAPYVTLKAGDYFYSGFVNLPVGGWTVYFASATAGVVVELIAWN